MSIVFSLFISLGFVCLFRNNIKKYSKLYYLASIILSIISIYFIWTGVHMKMPYISRVYGIYLLTKATIPTSLFILVMYTGALSPKSKLYKILMPIRAELSIIASILTLGHNVGYGKKYFLILFLGKKIPSNFFFASIFSLIAIVIMLPLFITSFKNIREKIKPKSWKNLQKLAYIFYVLIYLHTLLIYFPSAYKRNIESIVRIIAYHIIFTVYVFARVQKLFYDKYKLNYKFPVSRALVVAQITLYVLSFPILREIIFNNKSTELNLSQKLTQSQETKNQAKVTQDSKIKSYKDGEYEGTAYGYVDKIVVKVSIIESKISKIDILEESEDYEYMVDAKNIINDIISKNSTDVDTISGATTSSQAIKYAVKGAIKKAK